MFILLLTWLLYDGTYVFVNFHIHARNYRFVNKSLLCFFVRKKFKFSCYLFVLYTNPINSDHSHNFYQKWWFVMYTNEHTVLFNSYGFHSSLILNNKSTSFIYANEHHFSSLIITNAHIKSGFYNNIKNAECASKLSKW